MYKAPTEEVFQEMKESATEVWKTYDNTYGYVDEKLDRINSINNIQDNAMTFFRMFDYVNQTKMMLRLSQESLDYINENR